MGVTDWAVVTGASSGIGAAYAKELAQRGLSVVITGRRKEKLDAVKREIEEEHGVDVRAVLGDLAVEQDLHALVEQVRELKPLWLVNNAGFGSGGAFPDLDLEVHLSMLKVHAEATVRLTHAVLPAMIERQKGTIVNVSSVLGIMRSIGSPLYGGTKAFLTSFSTGLARDLFGTGVRVHALCPGLTRSDFHSRPQLKNYRPGRRLPILWKTSEEVVRRSLNAVDRGKVVFVPALIDRVIVWLAGSRLAIPAFRYVDRKRRALKLGAKQLQGSK